ncbi:hypothetical protein FRC07_003573 [Ceratobasidium sp. 392]|nr:hypothetical protein FRC07_003573 [Ceratobasidium sp. 392]
MSWDTTPASHRACSASNLIAGYLLGHPLDGRRLIDFKHNKTGVFLPWCKKWADGIQFKRLEYRKAHKSVRHQFICLQDLRYNPQMPLPQDKSDEENLWPSLGSRLEDRICQIERMANPEGQVNAIFRTSAADYLNIFKKGSDDEQRELGNTSVLLDITFPEYVDLSLALNICYRISCHPQACDYTLQQYNCYFFCWNIILGLIRFQANWGATLSNQYESIVVRAVDDWLQAQLADLNESPNLAIVVSGASVVQGTSSPLKPSLTQTVSRCFRNRDSLQGLKSALSSVLWTSEQEGAIHDVVSRILNEVADHTTNLVSNCTGELSIDDLFRRDATKYPLAVPQDWLHDIQREDDRAFNTFVNSLMWPMFAAALESKSKGILRDESRSQLSSMQKLRYSDPVLKARLSTLGYRTAWRNASASTSSDNSAPLRLLNAIIQMPRQLKNVSDISGPFVSIIAAELERRAAANSPMEIEGDGSHLLQLMVDMDVDYSGIEAQVVSQIEWSIKNIAQNHPGCDPSTLRLAALQLLMRLRQRGEAVKFYVNPRQTWRACLWYSLGHGITESLADVVGSQCASSEYKYQCQRLVTVSAKKFHVLKRCQLGYAEIQEFVRGRIQRLNEKLRKEELGSAESWLQGIERTMTVIWNDKRTWKDAL